MTVKRILYCGLVIGIVGALVRSSLSRMNASPRANGAVSVNNDDIAGVVTSSKGAEAGVWVIAETNRTLPTKYRSRLWSPTTKGAI